MENEKPSHFVNESQFIWRLDLKDLNLTQKNYLIDAHVVVDDPETKIKLGVFSHPIMKRDYNIFDP